MLKSGLFGIQEIVEVANSYLESSSFKSKSIRKVQFRLEEIPIDFEALPDKLYDIIVILPGIGEDLLIGIDQELKQFLLFQYNNGAVLSSACSGLFLLAKTGLLKGKVVTTQSDLGELFRKSFPDVHLIEDKIVVEDGNIVTAAGVSKWMHLTINLISRYTHSDIIIKIADFFQIDLDESLYRKFNQLNNDIEHNDYEIKRIQKRIHENYGRNLDFDELASFAGMSRRTLQRRFQRALKITPNDYLRNVRLERAFVLLETTNESIENIVHEIGYEDLTSFRKLFKSKTGLTPGEFRVLNR